jgi:hypothetical protein
LPAPPDRAIAARMDLGVRFPESPIHWRLAPRISPRGLTTVSPVRCPAPGGGSDSGAVKTPFADGEKAPEQGCKSVPTQASQRPGARIADGYTTVDDRAREPAAVAASCGRGLRPRRRGPSWRPSGSPCKVRFAFALEGVEWGPRRKAAGASAETSKRQVAAPAAFRWGHPPRRANALLLLAIAAGRRWNALAKEGLQCLMATTLPRSGACTEFRVRGGGREKSVPTTQDKGDRGRNLGQISELSPR